MQKAVHVQRSADPQLKKALTISVFIFLFGLFSGLFFSTGLSEENSRELSSLFISSISDDAAHPVRILLSSLFSNYTAAAVMMAAVLSGLLSFLPFAVLWYKSFAIGFCCGLIQISGAENTLVLSLTEIVPPAIFLIPASILLASVTFTCSREEIIKSKRPSSKGRSLIAMIFISLIGITAGCIVETLCHIL